MFKIKKQLSKLYLSSVLGHLSLTGAWVAILAARGCSLVEIGIAETVFHITSLIFEIPSGVFADVFGRKKMLIVSTIMRMIGNIIMILSNNIFMVCMSISFMALTYNFSSGSDEALAYDSLKLARMENRFEKYVSNQLMIYRLCSGISTLCAGFALTIGYKIAYSTGVAASVIQIMILFSLHEVYAENPSKDKELKTGRRLIACFTESFSFLKEARKAIGLMLCNSFVGAVDIRASLLYRLPSQASQTVTTGSINTSSVTITPLPPQTGHAPLLLKENSPASTWFAAAMVLRISSKTPKNVTGVERPVAVIGD